MKLCTPTFCEAKAPCWKHCRNHCSFFQLSTFERQHWGDSGNNCKEQPENPAQMAPRPISALQKCSLPARAHQGQVRNKSPGKISAPLRSVVLSPLLLWCSEYSDAGGGLGMRGTFSCSTDSSKPLTGGSKDQPLASAPVLHLNYPTAWENKVNCKKAKEVTQETKRNENLYTASSGFSGNIHTTGKCQH